MQMLRTIEYVVCLTRLNAQEEYMGIMLRLLSADKYQE